MPTVPARPARHAATPAPLGISVLLTGLPSAGKTTLAAAAIARLGQLGLPAESLDGDEVRRLFWPELGMSRVDREHNLTRIGLLARLLARNGVIAVVSAIAPFRGARERMRAAHLEEGVGFVEVHVATPLAECRRRDVKGLYARQARGELIGLSGVDAVYERPGAPDLRIDTQHEAVAESAERLVGYLVSRSARWAYLTG